MSFSSFYLSFSSSHVRFVPRDSVVPWKFIFVVFSFGAISLFSFAHYYHCDTMFVYFPSFPTILLRSHFTFLCAFVLLSFLLLSLSLSDHCLCGAEKSEKTRGHIKVCVDKAHTYTRSFDFMSSKTFQPTPSLDGRNMSARNDNSDGIVIRSHLVRMCDGEIGAASAVAAAATTTTHK